MKIEIENLSFTYNTLGTPVNTALRHIDLCIDAGEFVAITGASGSGKTTLSLQFTGLLEPDSGRVLVDGMDIRKDKRCLNDVRRRIGIVFQFPESQLFAETVYDDIAYAPRNSGLAEHQVQTRVSTALHSVAMDFDRFRTRSPFSLSAGEKRRVAIAGVLAMQPEVMILDEPTAGLDAEGRKALIDIILQQHSDGKTVILISHDLDLVASLANRVVVLQEGQIVRDGNKSDFFLDSALLSANGLVNPRILEVADKLYRMGLVPTRQLYSVPELKAALDLNIETVSK